MPDLERLTLRGAAEALQRSERTVRRYLREGRLTGDRVDMPAGGWQYLIPSASVENMREELQGGMPGGAQGGRVVTLPGAAAVGHDLTARLSMLETENAALREERDFLRRILENTTRALPPAPEPPSPTPAPVPWWRRVLGGRPPQ
jgi:hypothetical protein